MAQKHRFNAFSLLLLILYIVTFAVILYFFIDGFYYYSQSFAERVRHTDYKILKPGGIRGHGLGILGATMLVALLVYSLRKRIKIFKNFGNLSYWLKIHIFLGISGPLFIILHSTFKLNGLVAVSFWSMVIVALSGVLGRYLYNQIPRNIQGHELSLEEIQRQDMQLASELKQTFSLEDSQLQYIQDKIYGKKQVTFFGYLLSGFTHFLSKRKLKKLLVRDLQISKNQVKPLLQIADRKMRLEQRIKLLNKIQSLFHYWHVFHKPFAIVMYIVMLVHIGVSVWLGYTWVL